MQAISAVIVDDERLARNRIRRMLSLDSDVEIQAECSNGEEALETLKQKAPNLLFLDVQMPGMTGFEVLQALPPENLPVVVFVTAYDEYALRAFEAHAFDYLLKPFDRKRFQDVLRRAKSQIDLLRKDQVNARLVELLEGLERGRQDSQGRIAIRTGGHVILVKAPAIDWVEAADNYVCLHCAGETHVVRETMNAFERRLDSNRFLRIHRSTIVNLDRIKEMRPWFRGDYQVILQDGTNLTLSRSYRDRLKNVLLKPL
ncbi:MAG: response regulator transcription factor [Acidobacteria bacterium]|nr:response regulator transcription factor [Acidobacteriota bacterium]